MHVHDERDFGRAGIRRQIEQALDGEFAALPADELRCDGAQIGGSEWGRGQRGAGLAEILGIAETSFAAAGVVDPEPAGAVVVAGETGDDGCAEVDGNWGVLALRAMRTAVMRVPMAAGATSAPSGVN